MPNFCAIGYRRPSPKAFPVTFGPGGIWRRLYSLPAIRPAIRRATARETPARRAASGNGSAWSTSASIRGSSLA